MTEHLLPTAGLAVAVHLLDPVQGHPLQTWRFKDCHLITVGRSDNNDIVVVDPQVSRAHAKLFYEDGGWKLLSTGRHGTVVNDRPVTEIAIEHKTVFKLGVSGPTLRFDTALLDQRRSETIDQIDSDLLAALQVDESRKQEEVEQILGNSLFQELQEQSRRLRTAGNRPADAT